MKLTKSTLRKLIKEEFKTAKLAEIDDELPVADAGVEGELSPNDHKVLQQIQQRFINLAKSTDPNGEDVELQDYITQISVLIQKIERIVTKKKPGKTLKRGRVTGQAARRKGIETAKTFTK